MKRRAFLKAAAGLTVAAALPIPPDAVGDGVGLFSTSHALVRPMHDDIMDFNEANLELLCIELAELPVSERAVWVLPWSA